MIFTRLLLITWNIVFVCKQLSTKNKIGDRSRGQPEGSLFNSYNTEV